MDHTVLELRRHTFKLRTSTGDQENPELLEVRKKLQQYIREEVDIILDIQNKEIQVRRSLSKEIRPKLAYIFDGKARLIHSAIYQIHDEVDDLTHDQAKYNLEKYLPQLFESAKTSMPMALDKVVVFAHYIQEYLSKANEIEAGEKETKRQIKETVEAT